MGIYLPYIQELQEQQEMKEFPRRRDVRERLLALSQALSTVSFFETHTGDIVYGADYPARLIYPHDFDRDFLTDVRDAMRAGASLEEAVLAASEEAEPSYTLTHFDFDDDLRPQDIA